MHERGSNMKEQCMICGSMVEDVSGICPVCGAVLGRSTQVNPANMNYGGATEQPQGVMGGGSVYQNPNMGYNQGGYNQDGYNQGMYNYQDAPTYVQPAGKKGMVLSILSLVCAIIGVLLICFPFFSAVFCLASIILGIIALIKKQKKVPAIIGLIFGGIGGIICVFTLYINLMIASVCGTTFNGLIKQSFEVVGEGSTEITGVMIELPTDSGYEVVALNSDGSFQATGYSGYYYNHSYANEYTRDYMDYQTLYAMSQGYRMKDVTMIELYSEYGSEYYVFVVPEGWEQGDVIYYVEMTGSGDMDYTLQPVLTVPNVLE